VNADKASRSAVLVCQGRAAADGRIAPDRFADPVALELLRDDERVPVQRVRDGALPKGWAERLAVETVRASAEAVVPRTVAIDDAIRARGVPQLVILGAGLDARAWRMSDLTDVDVFEVDHPASQRDKRDRLGDRDPLARSVRFVPVDFTRDRLDTALESAGHRAGEPTTWVWEGVVPYLSRADVTGTVRAVAARSAPGSRFVVEYHVPALAPLLGRMFARVLSATAGQRSLWADEPRRSAWTPAAMAELLTGEGFQVVSDEDVYTVAQRIPIEVRLRRSLENARVAVADTVRRA